MKKLSIIILSFLFLASCSKDRRTEDEMINDYITENNLVGEFTGSGLFVSIPNPGNGDHPTIDNKVTTHYEGVYVSDGETFDSSIGGNPITFSLSNVIEGWKEGIPHFGVGDSGWLVIPARLAYGSIPRRGIRADAPMVFYIELIAIPE